MNNSGVFIEREIPDYVFCKKYSSIALASFDDVFCNRIEGYMEILLANKDRFKSRNCNVYLLDAVQGERSDKTFTIAETDIKQISSYLRNHKVDDIPFYPLLARKIVITNQQHEFCFYADRKYEVAILASDFNLFDTKLSELFSEMDVFTIDEYLQFMKRIMRPEYSFPDFEKKIKENYKVTTP